MFFTFAQPKQLMEAVVMRVIVYWEKWSERNFSTKTIGSLLFYWLWNTFLFINFYLSWEENSFCLRRFYVWCSCAPVWPMDKSHGDGTCMMSRTTRQSGHARSMPPALARSSCSSSPMLASLPFRQVLLLVKPIMCVPIAVRARRHVLLVLEPMISLHSSIAKLPTTAPMPLNWSTWPMTIKTRCSMLWASVAHRPIAIWWK